MKIKLDQEMQDEYGHPIKKGKRPSMKLRDVIVQSILTPINRRNGYEHEDDERTKQEKWDVFKKLRNERNEIELKTEEVTVIKKSIAKTHPQLLMGEAHEMIEGKYERMEPMEDYPSIVNQEEEEIKE